MEILNTLLFLLLVGGFVRLLTLKDDTLFTVLFWLAAIGVIAAFLGLGSPFDAYD